MSCKLPMTIHDLQELAAHHRAETKKIDDLDRSNVGRGAGMLIERMQRQRTFHFDAAAKLDALAEAFGAFVQPGVPAIRRDRSPIYARPALDR